MRIESELYFMDHDRFLCEVEEDDGVCCRNDMNSIANVNVLDFSGRVVWKLSLTPNAGTGRPF